MLSFVTGRMVGIEKMTVTKSVQKMQFKLAYESNETGGGTRFRLRSAIDSRQI